MEKAFSGRRQGVSETEKRFSMGYQQTLKRSYGNALVFVEPSLPELTQVKGQRADQDFVEHDAQ